MKEMGYGKDYKYAHDYPNHFVEQQNLPDRLQSARYYTPSTQGYEEHIINRLMSWWQRKTQPEGAETEETEQTEPDLSETEPEDNPSEES